MLFRYFDKEGYEYSEGIRDRLKQKIRAMVKNDELAPEQLPKERGAEPVVSFDLDHIASVFPRGCRDRAQIMSWMSTGLNTGARGISMESAVWEDVRIAMPVEERPDYKQVTLVWRETKGNRNWHHPVTVEGSVSSGSGSDAVYWLSELVKQRLGSHVELHQSLIESGKLKGQVFAAADGSPAVKSSLSARLGAVGAYCGYPAGMLSNHGLRAGFLCESLLKNAIDPRKEVHIGDVWQRCALVAGWTVNSRHMQGYCKEAFLRCLVSSRLVQGGGNTEDEVVASVAGVGAIAKNRLNPKDLHGLTELEVSWPESVTVQLWMDSLSDCIRDVLRERRPDLKGRGFSAAERYVGDQTYIQLAVLEGLCSGGPDGSEEEDDDDEYLSSLPSPAESRGLVKSWIASKFDEHPDVSWLEGFFRKSVRPTVVTLALSYVFDEVRSKAAIKVHRKRARAEADLSSESRVKARPLPARKKNKSGSLERVPWTDKETRVLCEGVVKYSAGKWATIAKLDGLELRTNMHCKDRMRVLVKQLDCDDAPEAAQCWLEEHPEGE